MIQVGYDDLRLMNALLSGIDATRPEQELFQSSTVEECSDLHFTPARSCWRETVALRLDLWSALHVNVRYQKPYLRSL